MDVHDKEDVAGRLGSKVRFYRVDVSNSSDITAAIEKILSWKRDIKRYIGGVVCCAGILGPAKVSHCKAFNVCHSNNFPDPWKG